MLFHFAAFCQEQTVEEYIEKYKGLAIKEMKSYHIPASVTLAQGILESENGNSDLAVKANNHFGIKCHKEWTGKTYYKDDDKEDECFRKYPKAEDSYRDHSEFLATRDRYKLLFDLDLTDYKAWAYGLKQAGYATNPRYPELLIRIIEDNLLYEFDEGGNLRPLATNQISSVEKENPDNESGSRIISSAAPQVFEISGRGGHDRVVFLNNGVKFILAREGDTFYSIAEEFNIYSWQVYDYNDMSKHDKILAGQKVYLERKKAKAAYDFHTIGQGESLYSVSQDYGIRLKSLSRRNNLETGEKLPEAIRLKLR
jgi:LysM repeat protein